MRPMCVFSYPSRKVLKSETLSSLSLYRTLFFRADNGNEGLDAQFSFFSPPQYQTSIRTEPGVLENVNSHITYLTLFHQTLISEHRFVY